MKGQYTDPLPKPKPKPEMIWTMRITDELDQTTLMAFRTKKGAMAELAKYTGSRPIVVIMTEVVLHD